MSAERWTKLNCDECDHFRMVKGNANDARREVVLSGWHRIKYPNRPKAQDICPNCRRQLGGVA